MSFEINTMNYPAKRLAGINIRTSMQKSLEDCPKAWEMFMPRMAEINAHPNESFGVSVWLGEDSFDYWAALELERGKPLPEGLQTVNIYDGLYARCIVPTIEKLGEAYMYLYTDWFKANPEYALNTESNCFELYPRNWNPGAPFDIYMPIKNA
jgi:predicted transcriptional regulator YdeE